MRNQCKHCAEQNASDARTLLRKGSFSGLRDTVKYALRLLLEFPGGHTPAA